MGEETNSKEVNEESKKFFFDTYAMVELLDGNKNYEPYKKSEVTITLFNLSEIYYHSLLEYLPEEAEEIYSKYKESLVEVDDETLKEAMKFRKKHKKQRISYTDSIGYIYAKRHNMKFLTGDKEFEGFDNVEFVKK